MKIYEREQRNYEDLNQLAIENGVVILGSSFAKDIPVYELRQSMEISSNIYNRSIVDLSVFDAKELLGTCVYALHPRRVLLNLGETDLECGFHTLPEIVEAYSSLIDEIKRNAKHCEVVLVSVCSNREEIHPEELNRQLTMMAAEKKCKFADISKAFSTESPKIKAFQMLKSFMRERMSFADAMLTV
ncbi:MAG: SGNH/GDSL hydrolase family protein [Lachnospira sp.]|nr:SGNH/GDSL hydrolase family protein [Lachnospira sp.]